MQVTFCNLLVYEYVMYLVCVLVPWGPLLVGQGALPPKF